MNGKRVIVLTLTLTVVTFGCQSVSHQSYSPQSVESLRGTTSIEQVSVAPEYKPWLGKTDLIARDFSKQPPLIPHKSQSQSQKINLKLNKCLTCHGLDEYVEAEAPKASETHFRDRDGNELANVSASRYFCRQCHIAQRDVAPLVSNEFKPSIVLQ